MFNYINYVIQICYRFLSFVSFDLRSGQIFIELKDSAYVVPFLTFLKNHSKSLCLSLADITAVDYLSFWNKPKNVRFQLNYNLLSHYFNNRIIVSVFLLDSNNPRADSISSIYMGASWPEREIWDMFGVFFMSHPDLRRILTDYGFDGFPLRKDFPLTGYCEVRYDDGQKCLVYEPLELSQELRVFDTLSPWVGRDEEVFRPNAI